GGYFADILWRDRRARPGEHSASTASAGRPRTSAPTTAGNTPADGSSFDGEFEDRARPRRFDLVRALLEVLAGYRPAVFPQQRANVEHAGPATIEIGLIVQREPLHPIAEIEQSEMAGSDHTACGARE